MKKFLFLLAVAAASAALINYVHKDGIRAQSAKSGSLKKSNVYGGYESEVAWGKHLVTIMACGDCHTPKKMTNMGPVEDSSLLLSGHPAQLPPPDVNRQEVQNKGLGVTQTLTAWVGPWGISYAANLTPDETGIGSWTEQQFITSLRQGKFKGLPDSRTLLPPMPWPSFRHMTDDEIKAVFNYLKSIKPINNVVPQAQPPVGKA